MSISIYLVLLIVLLIFNLVFWLLVIWFRILFDCDFGRCCKTPAAEDDEPSGHSNRAFEDTEDILGRPSFITERMEPPPTYDEALKYDQFGFYMSTPVHTTTSSSSPLPSLSPLTRTSVSPTAQDTPTSSGEGTVQLPHQTPPSRSSPDTTRSRASTTSSVCPLTPIREEEFDDPMPITVVIDCIGVQTSRILPNCDTKVNLAGGESLQEQSGC